jgi:hypothetical protein
MGLVTQALFAVVAVALGVWWVLPVPAGHPLPASNWGPNPDIPPPSQASLPTMRFPKRQVDPAWRPTAPEGFTVELFARVGLEHPRWLYELSNGDVLVAGEAVTINSDQRSLTFAFFPRSKEARTEIEMWTFEGWIGWYAMGLAGHTGRSPNRISLIRNGTRQVLLERLRQPLGMLLKATRFPVCLFSLTRAGRVSVRWQHRRSSALSVSSGPSANQRARRSNHYAAQGRLQQPLDTQLARQRTRQHSRHGRIGEQHWRARTRGRFQSQRSAGARSGHAHSPRRHCRHKVKGRCVRFFLIFFIFRNPVGIIRHPTTKEVWTGERGNFFFFI